MRVQFLWFAAYHAKQDHCSVLLCSNNRSKGKLGITFHHFPVDKYTKENWIVRIRQYVGKNFRLVIAVYDFKLSKLYLKSIADLHVAVIWLQLPEFLSTFLYYLNFEVPEGFK